MFFRGIEIKAEWIYQVIPGMKTIVLKKCPVLKLVEMAERQDGSLILLKLDTDQELQDAKFEHVQHIKKNAKPEDRVADHEIRDDQGIIDFSKMDRLIEMRKTPSEKAIERKEEMDLWNLMNKNKVEYNGPLKGSI